MEKLKVLVTGATGFIGSHLVRMLTQNGFEVAIIKRENSDLWRIEDILEKIAIYNVDLTDTKRVSEMVSHFMPDVVFHLATYYAVEHKLSEIPTIVNTNVLGTINLLEASKEAMVKRFVNTSSCFVYKESKKQLKETDDLDPLNLYAVSKLQGEQACSFYAQNSRLKIVTFRLFPPYGPADHERRLIPHIIKSFLKGERPSLTTGHQRWDFVNVHDIVNAYLSLVVVPDLQNNHEIFNIGTGNGASIRLVVSLIKEILNTDLEPNWGVIPHRKNEVWFTSADTSKAETILKWQPKLSLKEGLESTIKWYQNFYKMG